MKVAFPHMGALHIPLKTLLEGLGHEVVRTPIPNRKTIELGVRYAPEFACFPLKGVLGDFITACDLGAEALVILGGQGPCRFGWYGVTIQTILNRLGYSAKVLIFDNPSERWAREPFRILGLDRVSRTKALSAFLLALKKVRLVEWTEELARRSRPVEAHSGESDGVLRHASSLIDRAGTWEELSKVKRKIGRDFQAIERNGCRDLVRVGLVGEIYMVIEPNLNLRVEEKLGRIGALIDRKGVGMLKYLLADRNLDLFRRPTGRAAKRIAKPYLRHHCGGESSYAVGYSIHYAKSGFDGIVHISPLGCMPEIVAQTVLNKVSRDYDIPILNLVLDEHSGEGGIETRLEAFCDLLRRRRRLRCTWA